MSENLMNRLFCTCNFDLSMFRNPSASLRDFEIGYPFPQRLFVCLHEKRSKTCFFIGSDERPVEFSPIKRWKKNTVLRSANPFVIRNLTIVTQTTDQRIKG